MTEWAQTHNSPSHKFEAGIELDVWIRWVYYYEPCFKSYLEKEELEIFMSICWPWVFFCQQDSNQSEEGVCLCCLSGLLGMGGVDES